MSEKTIMRNTIFKPKTKAKKPVFNMPTSDNLTKLPEEQFMTLTGELKQAKQDGDKAERVHGRIKKSMEKLWDAAVVRIGGDPKELEYCSLSDAMLLVYETPERVDQVFGEATFKQTKAATSKGASTWRQPWRRVKEKAFPKEREIRLPIEKLRDVIIDVFQTKEVPYDQALKTLNRVYGKG